MAQVTQADGRKIRLEREKADFTVDELIAALSEREGLTRHPDHLRGVELGTRQPSVKLLNAIARVLDVPREALLVDDEPEKASA